MGALQGTLTYKLFYVQGELGEGWKDTLVERVQKRAFEALTPEDEEEERFGWVPIENPLRVEFDEHNILFDHFINLALRQDRYAIPSNLLKAHQEQAERDYRVEHSKERIGKFEKEDIKAIVKKKLKERSLPRMKVIDMSWDLRNNRVRFWNQSAKTCELFMGMFEDTFGFQLIPASPYTMAINLGLEDAQIERLQELEPCAFVDVNTLDL